MFGLLARLGLIGMRALPWLGRGSIVAGTTVAAEGAAMAGTTAAGTAAGIGASSWGGVAVPAAARAFAAAEGAALPGVAAQGAGVMAGPAALARGAAVLGRMGGGRFGLATGLSRIFRFGANGLKWGVGGLALTGGAALLENGTGLVSGMAGGVASAGVKVAGGVVEGGADAFRKILDQNVMPAVKDNGMWLAVPVCASFAALRGGWAHGVTVMGLLTAIVKMAEDYGFKLPGVDLPGLSGKFNRAMFDVAGETLPVPAPMAAPAAPAPLLALAP